MSWWCRLLLWVTQNDIVNQSVVDNPLFIKEARRVKRWHSLSSYRDQMCLIMPQTVALVALIWVGGLAGACLYGKSYFWTLWVSGQLVTHGYRVLQVIDETTSTIVKTVVIFSVILPYVFDLAYLKVNLRCINVSQQRDYWDLMRVSLLGEDRIASAIIQSNVMRGWRYAVFVMGIRVAVILMVFMTYIFVNTILLLEFSLLNSNVSTGQVVIIMAIVIFLILEPLWRMRVAVALSAVVALYTRRTTIEILSGFGSMVGIWLMLPLLLYGIVNMLRGIESRILEYPFVILTIGRDLVMGINLAVGVILALMMIYFYYIVVGRGLRWWLCRSLLYIN